MNPRFRQTHGDRWEWTPQRVLDARQKDAERIRWLRLDENPATVADVLAGPWYASNVDTCPRCGSRAMAHTAGLCI